MAKHRVFAMTFASVYSLYIEDPLMQELRYIDKLIDELARGKAMEKILRSEAAT